MNFIAKLLRGEAAATAIGYGVIAALVAVPEMTTVFGLGVPLRQVTNSPDRESPESAARCARAGPIRILSVGGFATLTF